MLVPPLEGRHLLLQGILDPPLVDPHFPDGDRQLQKWVLTYYFAENCMKIKEFGSRVY